MKTFDNSSANIDRLLHESKEVPIIILGWSRPELLERRLKEAQSQNVIIFVALDGIPKINNETVTEQKINAIKKCHMLAKQYLNTGRIRQLLIHKEHMGLRVAVSSALNWFFSQVEFGIIFEDDIAIKKSFIEEMSTLLRRYRTKNSIFHISGYSIFERNAKPIKYLSNYHHCWGWGTWKEKWALYNEDPENAAKAVNWRFKKGFITEREAKFWMHRIGLISNNTISSWATWWLFSWYQGGYALNTTVSMSDNEGFCVNATNTKSDISRRRFKMNIATNKLVDHKYSKFNADIDHFVFCKHINPNIMIKLQYKMSKIYELFKH